MYNIAIIDDSPELLRELSDYFHQSEKLDWLSLKIAEEAKKNASRNKIRLVFFVYAFN